MKTNIEILEYIDWEIKNLQAQLKSEIENKRNSDHLLRDILIYQDIKNFIMEETDGIDTDQPL